MTTTPEGNRGLPSPHLRTNGIPVFVIWGPRESTRVLPAFLTDISLTGALIDTPNPLPEETPVLIRLMKTGEAETVRARIVRVSERRRMFTTPWWKKRTCAMRVSFVEGCSYEFFKTATDALFARPETAPSKPLRDTA